MKTEAVICGHRYAWSAFDIRLLTRAVLLRLRTCKNRPEGRTPPHQKNPLADARGSVKQPESRTQTEVCAT
jgi:hypothetical protein